MLGKWKAPDGETFSCQDWLPDGDVVGVVICIHGLSGESGDFAPLAAAVGKVGFACMALNLRGQGHDPQLKRRGTTLDLETLSDDVSAFTREMGGRFPGLPVFLCGESMGALLMGRVLATRRLAVRGAIFSAPVVQLRKPTPRPIRWVLGLLARVVPHGRFSPSWFVSGKRESVKVTRDQAHADRIRSAPHIIRTFSFRVLDTLGRLMDESDEYAQKITTPCLVLAAGMDAYLSGEQVQAWFDQLAAEDKSFHLYPEAFHCLWNDLDRETVLADITHWLIERLD